MTVSRAFRSEFSQKNKTYYLTKKDTSNEIPFPAMENEDGALIGSNALPMLIGDEVSAAGYTTDEAQVAYDEMPAELKALVLRTGDNRGHLVRASKTAEERTAEVEAERDKENAFLKEKGYYWEKRGVYHSDPGELVDAWFLLNPDGEVVRGWKDIGVDELVATGITLKALLTQLGYYGQEAIDRAEAEATVKATRREMRAKVDAYFADDTHRTGETFEDTESLFTVQPLRIEKHYPRRQFRIENDCIWLEAHNHSDGDDWSLNNCDYGIATQFKFDAEIADCLRKLAS